MMKTQFVYNITVFGHSENWEVRGNVVVREMPHMFMESSRDNFANILRALRKNGARGAITRTQKPSPNEL